MRDDGLVRDRPLPLRGSSLTSIPIIQRITLHVPVADLPRPLAFFEALGWPRNPEIASDTAACVVLGEAISLMLSTHSKFRELPPKASCDTSQAVEVLFCRNCESRQEVDDFVAKALPAGGATYDKPEDLGFTYFHSFGDLDGHGWGLHHFSASPPNRG